MILSLFGTPKPASTFMLMRVLSPQNQPRYDFDPVWARKRASTFMLMRVLSPQNQPRHDFDPLWGHKMRINSYVDARFGSQKRANA